MHDASSKDPQMQVARTRRGLPIAEQDWIMTTHFVKDLIELSTLDKVLDACGGNGLFAVDFSRRCHEVTVVDINKSLLGNLEGQRRNIRTIHSDLISYLETTKDRFDKILFYAGIQYFSEYEVFNILRYFRKCLKPNGVALIGDIPDFHRRDAYLSESTRFEKLFDNFSNKQLTIGTWFTFEWIKELAHYHGFSECKKVIQPNFQIYHDFRFDVLLRN